MKKLHKICKVLIGGLSWFVAFGDKLTEGFGKLVEKADRIIHKKEYEKARRRAAFWRTILWVSAGALIALFFPYKISVEKNGDFEIRTLLIRVYRKTPPYNIAVESSESDEELGEPAAECEVVEQ